MAKKITVNFIFLLAIACQASFCFSGPGNNKNSDNTLEPFAKKLNLAIPIIHSRNGWDASGIRKPEQPAHPKVVEEPLEPVRLNQSAAYLATDRALTDLLSALREYFRSFLKEINATEASKAQHTFNQQIEEVWEGLQNMDASDEAAYLRKYANTEHSSSFLKKRYKLICVLQEIYVAPRSNYLENRSTLSDFKSAVDIGKPELLEAFRACMQQKVIDLQFKEGANQLTDILKSTIRERKGALDPTLEKELDSYVPSLVMDIFNHLYQKVFKKYMVEMGCNAENEILGYFVLAIIELSFQALRSEDDFCNAHSAFPISFVKKKYKLVDDFRQICLMPLKQCVENGGGFSRLKAMVEMGMAQLCDDLKAVMEDSHTKMHTSDWFINQGMKSANHGF